MQHGQISFAADLASRSLLALLRRRARGRGETVSIAWDPNPEADVVGYRVFIGPQPGSTTRRSTSGPRTSYSLSSAQPGSAYCLAVAAYTAGPNLGTKSAEVCTDANRPPTLSGPGNSRLPWAPGRRSRSWAADPEGLPVTFSAAGLPRSRR
jgi:hypothetical protein